MQSEIDLLKQRISELEAEKAELEAKNAELLKQVTEESTKCEAENVELKARIAKLEQTAEESRNWNSSTQSESSMEPETSTTSLPQNTIDDDSAEILDFVETIHKERINESEARSFASSNHVTEISATARRQNSNTISLLDLAQLFDKATDAKYYAIKANQEETLCWINYGKEFIIQYNDLHLNIIRERRSKEMALQLPEISHKTLCKKIQKAVRTYKLFEKIGIDKIKYFKAYSTNSISELTNEQVQEIINNISNNESIT
ncbi:hypothetical protein Glove_294g83 [Diversispora epigaea]|uniref:Uncharacterized protein n=1 Tax=Diversispora epigaea TaxID=1348612 RepID=A0A397I338_9GLOM|nr:hypothetical protein Glove_294g83 [Diversispora epigaea]